MDTIGLDLHKRESQLCIIGSQGEITEKRIMTTRERFTAVLLGRARCRILLASTESEWVARHLESLGHEVIVADPGFAPMYARRTKKVKTDKRDARTLAEACVLGAYRATHRVSTEQRHVRSELLVRDALVRTRTRYVSSVLRQPPDRTPKCAGGNLPPSESANRSLSGTSRRRRQKKELKSVKHLHA
jgi:transposase